MILDLLLEMVLHRVDTEGQSVPVQEANGHAKAGKETHGDVTMEDVKEPADKGKGEHSFNGGVQLC